MALNLEGLSSHRAFKLGGRVHVSGLTLPNRERMQNYADLTAVCLICLSPKVCRLRNRRVEIYVKSNSAHADLESMHVICSSSVKKSEPSLTGLKSVPTSY